MSAIRRFLSATLALALLLAACGAPGTPPPPPPTEPIDGPGDPVELDGAGADQASFAITNVGEVVLTWTIEVDPDPTGDNPEPGSWFSVSPTGGELGPGASQTLTLTLVPGLAAGSYRALLTIDYPGGRTAFEVAGEVAGDEPAPPPTGFTIALSPDGITLESGQSGSVTVTVTSDSSDGVSLDAAAPAGWSAELRAGTVRGQALLDVVVPASAVSGSYLVSVIGERGGDLVSADLSVQVVSDDSGSDPGNARIRGIVTTANADIPIVPPEGPLAGARPDAAHPPYVPGQLLVRYREDATDGGPLAGRAEARRLAVRADHGLVTVRDRGAGRAELVRLPDGIDPLVAARELADDPRVLYAEPNWYLYPQTLPNDPRLGDAWHLPLIGAPLAWEADGGSGVTVAVVDTGIDLDHPDLQGRFVSNGYDFCNDADGDCSERDGDPRPVDSGDVHGTHVTGLIAAVGGNGMGVAGVLHAQAAILPVKVFPDYPAATTADALADGILWAAGLAVPGTPANAHPAEILNLSLGTSPNIDTGSADFATLRDAVEAAQGAGALLVAAAGNGAQSDVGYPAAFPGVISVGSVGDDLTRACFSNTSSQPAVRARHIVAPGGDGPTAACPSAGETYVLSTVPGGYGLLAGTSQAAPLVSAAAALVWEAQTSPTPASVRSALLDSAWFDPAAMDAGYGVGVLRLDVALGFPGPGDEVSVSADSGADSAVDTVVLDPFGRSSDFELNGLDAGTYSVTATAAADRALDAVRSVVLAAGGVRDLSLRLTP